MRASLLVSVVVASALLLAFVDDESGLPTWFRLRAELAASEARIAVLQAETADLRVQIDDLNADPFAIERAIREDLELARPGEILVRFK